MYLEYRLFRDEATAVKCSQIYSRFSCRHTSLFSAHHLLGACCLVDSKIKTVERIIQPSKGVFLFTGISSCLQRPPIELHREFHLQLIIVEESMQGEIPSQGNVVQCINVHKYHRNGWISLGKLLAAMWSSWRSSIHLQIDNISPSNFCTLDDSYSVSFSQYLTKQVSHSCKAYIVNIYILGWSCFSVSGRKLQVR